MNSMELGGNAGMPPLLARSRMAIRVMLVLYWLAMFIGTHIPGQVDASFTWPDKFLHCGAYAGLIFLALSSFYGKPWSNTCRWMLILATYGAIDELTQIPVSRTCDPFDWTADLVGLSLGAVCFGIAFKLFERLSQRIGRRSSIFETRLEPTATAETI